MKNAFITKAETTNAGTKFITRDKVQQVRSAQRNSLLNEIEARPVCTPGREGRGCAPSEEDGSKEAAKSVI